jgi:serine O-acetyltransferase
MNSDLAGLIFAVNSKYCTDVPSLTESQQFVDEMFHLLFPVTESNNISLREVEIRLDRMKLSLKELLTPLAKDLQKKPKEIAADFFNHLPEAYKSMLEDADTFMKSDPAAERIEEVILCYPGFFSLTIHRMANILYKMNVPVLPRVMSEYVHSKTGIDIHPGATMGRMIFIDHGTGIVIGETAIVGDRVKIYQGVTLGALFVEKSMSDTKRHPTIEDDVIIYAGSTILGGKTIVGHDTIIGGNVWLTESVLPHSVVYRQHKVLVKDSKSFEEPVNFVI